jgi:voltage-gated potassium channel Kch
VLGAFIAGLFLREGVLGASLTRDLMGAVRDASIGFLAPIFFVTAGFQVSLSVFGADLWLFLSILGVATVGKILGTAVFYGQRPRLAGRPHHRRGHERAGGRRDHHRRDRARDGDHLPGAFFDPGVHGHLHHRNRAVPAEVGHRLAEVARRIGADHRRPPGRVILGAGRSAWSWRAALSQSRPVWLVDRNQKHCDAAMDLGLHAVCGNALEEQVLSEAHAGSATMLLAMTSNAEINALAAQIARSTFMVPEIYVAREGSAREGDRTSLKHLRASALFASPAVLADWDHHIVHGAVRRERHHVERAMSADELVDELRRTGTVLPLVVFRDGEADPVHSDLKLHPGDEVLYVTREA